MSETDACQEVMVGMQHDLYHIGDRIRKLRRILGLTQKEFSEKIGISRSRVAEIEAGEPTKESVLIAISRTFGVSLEWLKYGTGEMFLLKEELIPAELVAIPVITEAGAGVRYTPDHVLIERSRLKHYKVEAFKVVGDSMMPTVQEGEYVLIDRQDTELYDNVVYLIACEDNGIKIRRLRHISGQWWAFADNPKYAPEPYTEGCKIIGRVVAVYKPAELRNL
ncbi:MAG: XRE family transcriptional regulator [Desulfurococcaceae archaeon]